MCDFLDHGLERLPDDEWVLDTPHLRAFVADVRHRISHAATREDACRAVEPAFSALLADRTWLPEVYQEPKEGSGMGGGIGQWLLFRSADRSLCLFSLVVPSGSMTPIHDHLAWGLIGLYRGGQDEEIYRPGGGGLETVHRRPVAVGAAELISQVRAISQQQQELSVGEVQQFTVVAERMTFLVSAVARGYYLLLALAPAGSVGRARFELRRASLVLEEELS